MEVKIKSVIR